MLHRKYALAVLLAGFPVSASFAQDRDDGADASRSVIEIARSTVVQHRMAKRPDCLAYTLADAGDAQSHVALVDVRERHGGSCGGDPAIQRHLFFVRVDPRSGAIWTDAAEPGEFVPVRSKR